jgi:hypothetical protein
LDGWKKRAGGDHVERRQAADFDPKQIDGWAGHQGDATPVHVLLEFLGDAREIEAGIIAKIEARGFDARAVELRELLLHVAPEMGDGRGFTTEIAVNVVHEDQPLFPGVTVVTPAAEVILVH